MKVNLLVSTALVATSLVTAALAGDELAIGAKGPDFSLKGTDGQTYSLQSVAGTKGTAVIFTCNECPFSKGYEDRLIALTKEYKSKGIGFIAINPNDPKVVPGDGFEFMVKRAQEKGFPFPYVVDETQTIAAAYGAKVTPHVFLLDAKGTLVYRGRVDDSLKEQEVKKRDFKTALDALVAGSTVLVAETKAFGCGVKWSKKQT
jgi:peroxiredoxin